MKHHSISLGGQTSQMEQPANFKSKLAHVVALSEICTSGAHRPAESVAIFGHQKPGCGPPPLLLAWFGPSFFLLVFENETAAMMTPNWPSYMQVQKASPVVLPAVAEILGVLHKLGRGQQLQITKISVYIVRCSLRTFRYSIVHGIT
jgi:hypothetical protein